MSTELDSLQTTAENEYESYRSLSTAAVAALIVGLLSTLAFLNWSLVTIPIIGVAVSAYAWHQTRRHADELTGEKLAKLGLFLSAAMLALGPAWLTYDYYAEVPEGYARISYAELQPDPNQSGQLVPDSAMALDGQQVFIKGYVLSGTSTRDIREFLLVRDQGDCCFGANPKITERIQVTLEGPLRLDYQQRIRGLAGTFTVKPMNHTIDGVAGGVLYHLQADQLK